jgi:hypothetical protein
LVEVMGPSEFDTYTHWSFFNLNLLLRQGLANSSYCYFSLEAVLMPMWDNQERAGYSLIGSVSNPWNANTYYFKPIHETDKS